MVPSFGMKRSLLLCSMFFNMIFLALDPFKQGLTAPWIPPTLKTALRAPHPGCRQQKNVPHPWSSK
jgi:hypothetical protein